MLEQRGYRASAEGVANLYADFAGTFVIDPLDKSQAQEINKLGMKVVVLPTVMKTRAQKRQLASAILSL